MAPGSKPPKIRRATWPKILGLLNYHRLTRRRRDSNGAAAPNPFNVAALRLPPSFEQTAGVKKMITTVPVRKPNRQEWIRVHPGEDYRGDFATIHLKQDGEYYFVVPAMIESLRNELTLITIYTTINKAGVVFLWPAPRPGSEGRGAGDTWHRSAHEAAATATKRLTRVTPTAILAPMKSRFGQSEPDNDPVWPDLSFTELLRIGFEKVGRYVKDFEHPVIKYCADCDARGSTIQSHRSSDFEFEFGGRDGNRRARSAWWPRNCAAARSGEFGAGNSRPGRHSRPGPIRYSSPSSLPPSSAASALWAGRCRRESSISMQNSATA